MNAAPRGAAILRAFPAAIACLFAAVCIAGLWRIAATLGMHVPFDPNEGWNAYHAQAAMAGGALYPGAGSYLVNNYPPLSFYVVGILGRIIGDGIVAGRIVALVAFLAVFAAIAGCACALGAARLSAVTGALFFAACLIVGSDYVGMDDPQMLGHALALAGLLLILRAGHGSAIAAALFFALAFFVKHNLVALPLATAVWLALNDRPKALRFAIAGAAFVVAGLVLFRLLYGSDLLAHLTSPRSYSFALLRAGVAGWLVWSAVPLIALAGLAWAGPRDRAVTFCSLYAAAGVAAGIGFAGGAGVDFNAFFDADIALALGTALALSRLSSTRPAWKAAALAAALLLPLGAGLAQASAGEDWRDADYWLHPLSDEQAEAGRDIAFLQARHGPALCEMLSLCYWAGKPAQVDVFNTGQAYATGARRDGELAAWIGAQRFAVVEFDTLAPFALTARVRTALLRAYRVDHADDDGVFLVPREAISWRRMPAGAGRYGP